MRDFYYYMLCFFLVVSFMEGQSIASSFSPPTQSSTISFRSHPRSIAQHLKGGQQPKSVNTNGPTSLSQSSTPNETSETSEKLTGLRASFPNFPWHRVPNFLTYLRCIAIPILIYFFYQPNQHIATGTIFAFASLTDWFDGYLARKWNAASRFGAFLDPVADKLTVSTALILLTGRYGALMAIPTCIILAREISVSALREWMAQRGLRDIVKVGMQGKVKTFVTMIGLTVLLLIPEAQSGGADLLSKLYRPGVGLLYFCSVITVTSGLVYFRAAAPVLLGAD